MTIILDSNTFKNLNVITRINSVDVISKISFTSDLTLSLISKKNKTKMSREEIFVHHFSLLNSKIF